MSKSVSIPRVTTFDIMRGFFLIAIIMSHLAFFPNLYDWWGMRGQLLVSTAEGFFLLSGIVLGLVRGAKLIHEPFKKVMKIVVQRAGTLYLTHIILVIAFTVIGWLFYMHNPGLKYGIMADHSFFRLVFETVTLQYTYGWADYLRFYAIFIAISPLALWLLRKGKWYIVLLISFLTWLIFPIDPVLPWEQQALLQPIPWQFLFFSGLAIGFHWPGITLWFKRHQRRLTIYVVYPLVALALATLLINVFAVFFKELYDTAWTRELSYDAWKLHMIEFNKEQLPFQRIALFFLWFWAAFFIIQKFEKSIIRYTGWLLIPFGTNSLYVYTLHAVIVFFVHLYFKDTTIWLNFLVTTGIIAIIYLAIRTKFLMKIIPR